MESTFELTKYHVLHEQVIVHVIVLPPFMESTFELTKYHVLHEQVIVHVIVLPPPGMLGWEISPSYDLYCLCINLLNRCLVILIFD
jgi:uncharacterized protein YqhQ